MYTIVILLQIRPSMESKSNLESWWLLSIQIESIFVPLNQGLRVPCGHTVEHKLFLSLHQSHVVWANFESGSHCLMKEKCQCHRKVAKWRANPTHARIPKVAASTITQPNSTHNSIPNPNPGKTRATDEICSRVGFCTSYLQGVMPF